MCLTLFFLMELNKCLNTENFNVKFDSAKIH